MTPCTYNVSVVGYGAKLAVPPLHFHNWFHINKLSLTYISTFSSLSPIRIRSELSSFSVSLLSVSLLFHHLLFVLFLCIISLLGISCLLRWHFKVFDMGFEESHDLIQWWALCEFSAAVFLTLYIFVFVFGFFASLTPLFSSFPEIYVLLICLYIWIELVVYSIEIEEVCHFSGLRI